jgi:hypothetical protein
VESLRRDLQRVAEHRNALRPGEILDASLRDLGLGSGERADVDE